MLLLPKALFLAKISKTSRKMPFTIEFSSKIFTNLSKAFHSLCLSSKTSENLTPGFGRGRPPKVFPRAEIG